MAHNACALLVPRCPAQETELICPKGCSPSWFCVNSTFSWVSGACASHVQLHDCLLYPTTMFESCHWGGLVQDKPPHPLTSVHRAHTVQTVPGQPLVFGPFLSLP